MSTREREYCNECDVWHADGRPHAVCPVCGKPWSVREVYEPPALNHWQRTQRATQGFKFPKVKK